MASAQNPPQTDTTIATWANAIRQTLNAYEIDPVPIFREAGLKLNTKELKDPAHRYFLRPHYPQDRTSPFTRRISAFRP